ncbi:MULTISPECIES: nitrite reductase small subunit NirD [Cobetia]|uniref:Nitrite reductase small subunit NirD n=1 Tax=Cobetia crustatorum TaxID=553385 RepID=A0A558HHC7_9GAMM|nr:MULTISPECIES: nitrite reductase small subunit NirD [Cobetia]TVU68458.1 nitrite reductase small subunit NirD [Cobetia crustatorum]
MTTSTLTATNDTSVDSSHWVTLCQRKDLVEGSGVAAWHETTEAQQNRSYQIALFTLPATGSDAMQVFAIDHHDPVSGANVMARGLLGDQAGEPLVISPLYKQRYRLKDGQCMEDAALRLKVWPVRIEGEDIQVGFDHPASARTA